MGEGGGLSFGMISGKKCCQKCKYCEYKSTKYTLQKLEQGKKGFGFAPK